MLEAWKQPTDWRRDFLFHFLMPLAVIVGGLGLALLAAVLWMTRAQDRAELGREKQLIETAIAARQEMIRRNLGDYGVWDDAVERLVLRFDPEFVRANYAPYLYSVQGYEHVFVVDGRDRILLSSDRDRLTRDDPAALLGAPYASALRELRRRPVGTDQRLTGLTRVRGMPALFGIAAVVPSDTARLPPGPATYIVFVKLVDPRLLGELGRNYDIRGLQLASAASAPIVLRDPAGRSVGGLAWDEGRPGTELRARVLPLVLLVFLLIGVLCHLLVLQSRSNVRRMIAAQRQASADATTACTALDELHDAKERLVAQQEAGQEELRRTIAAVRQENERLNAAMAEQRVTLVAELAEAFEQTVGDVADSLLGAARQLGGSASQLDRLTRDTRAIVTEASIRADDASGAAGEVATATQELLASIVAIATEVKSQADLSRTVVRSSAHGDQVVRSLADGAADIGTIVGSIEELATQTDLLALNASIEAVRAGPAGAGFSIVASEVKGLAGMTAQATSTIAALVLAVQEKVGDAVATFGHVSGQVGSMSAISTTIASAVEEQRSATDQIDRHAAAVATSAREIKSRFARVAQTIGSAGELSAEVARASSELAGRAEQLRAASAQFIERLRAA
ncbi:hypothetical protein HMF7854_03550 [Sphingomonas ginkgonis]|uniref:Methyl-accepting transducer domain-containing protein n=1 Tax=Sphingomonas ginkgonis TaxID=2315330 RepID=A0A3R9Z538_9SPHN|nr:methyl-accepting chemotaxis protein [Sphingomonas ginkgonis]RST30006.1 hypothetical protein HMF7854_03550 [Sphingomonas ginkgonis]